MQSKKRGVECDLCGAVMRIDHLAAHRNSRKCRVRCDVCCKVFQSSEIQEHRKEHVLNLDNTMSQSLTPLTTPITENQGILDDEYDAEFADIYQTFESSIKDYFKPGKLMDRFNFEARQFSSSELIHLFKKVYKKQQYVFKFNISFGYILENIITNEYALYQSSQNNQLLLNTSMTVRNTDTKHLAINTLLGIDLIAHINRPSTKWVFTKITNVTFYVYKMTGKPIGGPLEIPDYLMRNKGLYSLVKDWNGKIYTDQNCFFRCVALHKGDKIGAIEKTTKQLVKDYCEAAAIKDFQGLSLDQLEDLSKYLGFGINVYTQDEGRNTKLVFRSISTTNTMNLNLYGDPFSYIKSMNIYARCYHCEKCNKIINHHGWYVTHVKNCDANVKEQYVGGTFSLRPTVFELLDKAGVFVPSEMRFFPYRAVFDIECFLVKDITIQNTDKVTYCDEHNLASISICSNVPGYKKPKCFVIGAKGSRKLVEEMLQYLIEISEASSMYMRARFADYLPQILELGGRLSLKFEEYLSELPVLSFNGAHYDLKVLREELIPVLVQQDIMKFVIKKGTQYMCVSTKPLKFLDIRFYIAPGFNYAKFLKAHGVDEMKGHFPYNYFDGIDRLKETQFPPFEEFKDLVSQPGGLEKYNEIEQIFYSKKWTFKEYLQYYNNLDTGPFIEALDNLVKYYNERNIDPFKDAISGKTCLEV